MTNSYSLYPEFISSELLKRWGIFVKSVSPIEENDNRFENWELFYLNYRKKMNGTFDPEFLLLEYNRKKIQEIFR